MQSRETSFGGGGEDTTLNIKPMQPILRGYALFGPNIHMPCMGESYHLIYYDHT